MEPEVRIIGALRDSAAENTSVVDLIRLTIQLLREQDPRGVGRLQVVFYLCKAFGIPLDKAASVGGWVGFQEEGCTLTDEDLEETLREYIKHG